MTLRQKKPNYAHIAEMERDLDSDGDGLFDDEYLDEKIAEAVQAQETKREEALDARRSKTWKPGDERVVDLSDLMARKTIREKVDWGSHKRRLEEAAFYGVSASSAASVSFAPGARWVVSDPNFVQVYRGPYQ